MNVKLLKKLRKEAYNKIKLKYDINNGYYIINKDFKVRYYFSTNVSNIEDAKKRLIIARRFFIEQAIKDLRLIKYRRISKAISKKLDNL